jgi:hypothetical protein
MTDQNAAKTEPGAGFDYPKVEAMVGRLADAIAQSKVQSPDSDRKAALRADYQSTVEVIKLLSDIRFRCLVFVTAVIAVANALLPGTGDSGTRVALGVVGFLATLGIAVYELRNSQLYEAATHRAKMLETALGAERTTKHCEEAGLFNERPPYVDDAYWKSLTPDQRKEKKEKKSLPLMSFWSVNVKHDYGLAVIYGAALGGWVYLIADGLLSIPPPGGFWPPAPPGLTRIISALLGLSAFGYSVKSFVYHDKNRLRPAPPANPTENVSAAASSENNEEPAEVSEPPRRKAARLLEKSPRRRTPTEPDGENEPPSGEQS